MVSPIVTVQRALYIGNSLSGIFYGVQFVLCFQSIHCLKIKPRPRTTFYIGFSLVLLFFNTISFAANTLYGQYVWIERGQSVPGGPAAYFNENLTWWEVNTFGTTASVTADVISQALLLFRCYIIMDSNLWIILLPTLMLLASTALAIIATIESANPSTFLLRGVSENFGVPWVSISVSFNILVTAIISSRLLYAHNKWKRIFTVTENEAYTGIMAIMVESALPLTVSGILFAVFYGKNSPAAIAFAAPWGAFVAIYPQLIILRVSMGIAWSGDTITNGTKLQFAAPELTGSADVESHVVQNEIVSQDLGHMGGQIGH